MKTTAIGLMSGTSLDGLDICLAEFEKLDNTWSFKILEAETISYNENWENRLRNAVNLNSEDLLALNSEYGFFLGKKVKDFLTRKNIQTIDLISSHGHTVFHQPQRKFTLQIGDGRAIKLETSIPTIYDFRSQDVLMGGNGAPLVPIGDELLFSEYDACLNLGGFSNISFKKENQRIALDICPVNIVLNKIAQNFGEKYDENGDLAKSGTIDFELLEKLNSLEFYHLQHPKSLGIEWCNENVFRLLENIDSLTALATFTEHSAVQISKIFNENELKKALFTGGGTYNQYLIEKIKAKTSIEIIIPDQRIIDFKEALIFGFMGVLRMNGEINVLSSATGSLKDQSSGIIA
ncbi:anhydro-N-acetylmuramic acid kinase [Chryseobacterium sp.]|uniref:anhydro-N-acetylmuramic acid kinase n=1 Tax=Chryseobacterium sp. TaxID=1871047 RepID=UPI0028A28F37|nr:anhydro-N-acetylmuramic acid kinase [Chryseobacterium sp.]